MIGGTWPFYSEACHQDVDELLKRGGSLSAYRANKDYGSGPAKDSWAERLEREIEKKFKVKHAVAVNSGTAGLHCALAALDLKGGEVITSPYTFSATAAAILHAGGTPRFADVNPQTFVLSPDTARRVVGQRTRAILPVSLFGRATDIEGFRKFRLPIIEDACQAVGASIAGAYSGTRATAGVYSFNGGKNVPAGEAGALVTNSAKIAEKARLLMNHGENFGTDWVGYNYRPNELTCCVAWHGLVELEERNKQRQKLAGILNQMNHFHPRLTRTIPSDERSHVWYVYPFLIDKGRKLFAERMKERGIAVGQGYITPPLHHYKAFRKYAKRELPVVDELSFKTLCLFSHVRPPATEEDMRYTAKCMREALR